MNTQCIRLVGAVAISWLAVFACGKEWSFDDAELTAESAAISHQIVQWRETPAAQERLAHEAVQAAALIAETDRDPVDVVLRRAQALLADIEGMPGAPRLTEQARRLRRLERGARRIAPDSPDRKDLFARACALRREIAFKNPLLDFDRILFLEHNRARYEHMVDQYYGFHAARGGGVFVLEDAFGERPTVRDLLETARVENGRLEGRTLEGGSFISLELGYDAQRILFSWTEAETPVTPTDRTAKTDLWNP
ncbi:MAG: hypothetical protein FJY92_06315, partial [Candidatus Hydrogenedentes bacterium]|nr:hypothetical protein [Candidatus Hydrogenedentota bacterium]